MRCCARLLSGVAFGGTAGSTSPQLKSDISDFGQLIVPNSGKPEFGRGEVASEASG